MSEYRLHGFAESGNSYKVALYLAAVGADWECAPVLGFYEGASRDAEWRAKVNEMGEVPTLEHEGRFYSQSGAILDYLTSRFNGAYGWTDEDERREILRWILFDNHKFTGNLANARFRAFMMGKRDETTQFFEKRLEAALSIVEARLARQDWIALERPTIADFSLAGYVFFDNETHVDWKAWPAANAWRGRVRGLPNWKRPYEMMPRLREPAA